LIFKKYSIINNEYRTLGGYFFGVSANKELRTKPRAYEAKLSAKFAEPSA